jgi:xanthine/uracil/vitamin C permease (AzgA family)
VRRRRGYSIATGIELGFIAYVALKALAGGSRRSTWRSPSLLGAFLLKLIFA